jgi:hypothetical protein
MASKNEASRSQRLRGLRCRSATARLLTLGVWIPPRTWMSLSCECYILSGKVLCEELIARPQESYGLCWVVCDLDTSRMRRPLSERGLSTVGWKEFEGKLSFPFWSHPGCNDVTMWFWVIIFLCFKGTSCFHPQSEQSESSKFETKSYRCFVHKDIRMLMRIIFESFYVSLRSLSNNLGSYYSLPIFAMSL